MEGGRWRGGRSVVVDGGDQRVDEAARVGNLVEQAKNKTRDGVGACAGVRRAAVERLGLHSGTERRQRSNPRCLCLVSPHSSRCDSTWMQVGAAASTTGAAWHDQVRRQCTRMRCRATSRRLLVTDSV